MTTPHHDHELPTPLRPLILVVDEGQKLFGGVPAKGKSQGARTLAIAAALRAQTRPPLVIYDGKNSPDWRELLNHPADETPPDGG